MRPCRRCVANFGFALAKGRRRMGAGVCSGRKIIIGITPNVMMAPRFRICYTLRSGLPVIRLITRCPRRVRVADLKRGRKSGCVCGFHFSHLKRGLVAIRCKSSLVYFLSFFIARPLRALVGGQTHFVISGRRRHSSSG